MSAKSPQLDTARAIHRRTGRTFHLATRLLPPRAQNPTHILYAFFRVADEIVDDQEPSSPAAQRRELAALRAEALGEREPSTDVLMAFAAIREGHDLDEGEIEIFLDAMAQDLEQSRYATTDAVGEYLRGSSVAVSNCPGPFRSRVPSSHAGSSPSTANSTPRYSSSIELKPASWAAIDAALNRHTG